MNCIRFMICPYQASCSLMRQKSIFCRKRQQSKGGKAQLQQQGWTAEAARKKKKKAKSWLTGLFFHIYLNCNPTQSHSHHTFILNKSSSKIKMITSQCWEGESQDAFLTSSHWLLPEKCRPWVGSLLFPDTEALVNRATFSPGMAFTACLSTHPSICPQLF